jgi:hypothetical protein
MFDTHRDEAQKHSGYENDQIEPGKPGGHVSALPSDEIVGTMERSPGGTSDPEVAQNMWNLKPARLAREDSEDDERKD